jgi:hypothetical protein
MPPDQRTNYHCDRDATGPLNRKQLIEHINKIAIETPDKQDPVPFVAGVVRGKKVHFTFRHSINSHLSYALRHRHSDIFASILFPLRPTFSIRCCSLRHYLL